MTNRIHINGVDTAYRFDGPADGPVVLMSNSLMSSYDMWNWTVPALTDRYRVLRYDTRGHGRSSTPTGPYSISVLADDAALLLDALDIDSAHIVGLSMGGMVAQQHGARYAHRVRSLSICNSASEMPPRSLWDDRLAVAAKYGIGALVEGTIKRWFTPAFVARAPHEIAKVRAFIEQTQAPGYMACAAAIRDMAQTTMLLKIKAPTLVMTGRQDPATTVDNAIVLHRIIDGSTLHLIDDAAHLSNIEQPAAFNGVLRTFIDGVEDALMKSNNAT